MAIEQFTDTLMQAAKASLRLSKTKKQFKRHNFLISKKWFDRDCKIKDEN